MARLKAIIFFLLLGHIVLANDTLLQYKLHKQIPGKFTNFTVDNLGNIYVVTTSNQIKKLNNNLDSVAVFNDIKRFGKIDIIDVTNPLKVLIYYKNIATIVVLDRFLNIKNTIDLRKLGIVQVNQIAQSYDNHIWIFDELDAAIKKIDDFGNLLQTSADLRVVFNNATPYPSFMQDDNGLLYLYNQQEGWFLFDYYGALKNKYVFTGWQNTQVKNGTLLGNIHNNIFLLEPAKLLQQEKKTNILLTRYIKWLKVSDKFLYALDEKGIDIFYL
jgi:hypothetical protein